MRKKIIFGVLIVLIGIFFYLKHDGSIVFIVDHEFTCNRSYIKNVAGKFPVSSLSRFKIYGKNFNNGIIEFEVMPNRFNKDIISGIEQSLLDVKLECSIGKIDTIIDVRQDYESPILITTYFDSFHPDTRLKVELYE